MTQAQEKLKLLLDHTDKNGKRLEYKPEEGGKIYLEIDEKVRCLGFILIGQNNILYTKQDDERNIFRKTNSWSINSIILGFVDTIHIETSSYGYVITKEEAEEFGEYLHFQDTTELKVYIPLQYWAKRHKGLGEVYPQELKYRNAIGDSWYEKLKGLIDSPLLTGISKWLKERRQVTTVYPTGDRVFRALQLCSFHNTKVCIVGQDCYIDGSASGLAFGYLENSQKPIQKSLNVIYNEVQDDVYSGFLLDYDYTLESWAKQGVLLLNSILTVDKGRSMSHSELGWQRFTKQVIYELLKDKTPRVFMIWGKESRNLFDDIFKVCEKNNIHTELDSFPHKLLYAPHPASDLYKRDNFGDVKADYPNTFTGCKHFSRANSFLKENKRKEIKW